MIFSLIGSEAGGQRRSGYVCLFVFAAFCWALWTTRNKMVIEKKFPRRPTDVVYTALSFLQVWSFKLKEDQERISQFRMAIMRWLKEFKPSQILMSDVVEV